MTEEFKVSKIVVYQSRFWTEGDDHGGDIDLAHEISMDKIINNIFDDVADSERVSGDTEYRKIFVRNENLQNWADVKAWIEQFTLSSDDEVSILSGGSKSKTSTVIACTGTATWAASTAVVGSGTKFLTELAVGEKIYNATDDAEGDGVAIASIESDTALTLAGAYGGTAGATKTVNVAGIDQSTFVSPSSKTHGDVLLFGDISKNESKGIWIKRVVDAAAAGYTNNQFALKLESA
jgi:hypothetical protein